MREADFFRDGWTLESGEDYHRSAPETFEIPPLAIRQHLAPGDVAKLIFRIARADDEDAYERMWVVVTRRTENGYVGILDNEPNLIAKNADFWLGSELPFRAEHIIDAVPVDDVSCAVVERGPVIPWR